MNKYFERLSINENQRVNTMPNVSSNTQPNNNNKKVELCKTESSVIELHNNIKHLINNSTTKSFGVREVVINEKDDV